MRGAGILYPIFRYLPLMGWELYQKKLMNLLIF